MPIRQFNPKSLDFCLLFLFLWCRGEVHSTYAGKAMPPEAGKAEASALGSNGFGATATIKGG